MKKTLILIVVVFFVFGLTVYSDDISVQFYKDIASYFETEFDNVSKINELEVADDELAVVFFIAQKGTTSPERITETRKRGDSWYEICKSRGVTQKEIYVLVMSATNSKVYEPIFEKFKSAPEDKWNQLLLTDEDIINLVNLRVISSRHDYSMFEIMAMRDHGKGFARINNDIFNLKAEFLKNEKMAKKQSKESIQESQEDKKEDQVEDTSDSK